MLVFKREHDKVGKSKTVGSCLSTLVMAWDVNYGKTCLDRKNRVTQDYAKISLKKEVDFLQNKRRFEVHADTLIESGYS
jgi:hypothetical protein